VGKVQLAMLPPADVERLYTETNLTVLTERALRGTAPTELQAIAERGYALENEECDAEVRSIAVPVRISENDGALVLLSSVAGLRTNISIRV
jgi:DNA-binding IclR family transcriptional regulator